MTTIAPAEAQYLMDITPRPGLILTHGAGSYVFDDQGRRYLDFIQGWAVNALGHAPSEVHDALADQSQKLVSPSPAFHNAPQLELASRLTRLSGFDQVFFTNSGAEANEGAIKLCRKWGRLHKNGAHVILTAHNSFHGRTLATMAASGKAGWDELFPPPVPGFVKVPYGDADAMARAVSANSAAIMVEPIQGEAGVVVPPPGYLRALRDLCHREGMLLVLDEVQTGVGRTGTMFAFQREDAIPDIMTLGKGLGGGVPIGALVATRAAACFEHGDQGGTFNGNPLMTAVANRVLRTISEPGFLEHVCSAGRHLYSALSTVAGAGRVVDVRGRGLLWALVLAQPVATQVRDECLSRGLLVNAARPNVLRFMPSLRVTLGEIDEMTGILRAAFIAVE